MVDLKGNTGADLDAAPSLEDTHHGAAEDAIDEVATNGPVGGDLPPQTAAAKRPAATKEPCPFRWKLIGESKGAILTLFKSTDRSEVESQCERALADGYYSNLRIVEIDEKIVQPPSAARLPEPKPPVEVELPVPKLKPTAEPTPDKASAAGSEKAKTPKKAAVKSPQPRKSGKPVKPSPAKTPAKKVPTKKATKPGASPKGKKKTARKPTGKRAAKKK